MLSSKQWNEWMFNICWQSTHRPEQSWGLHTRVTWRELRHSALVCRSSKRKGLMWNTLWNLVNCPKSRLHPKKLLRAKGSKSANLHQSQPGRILGYGSMKFGRSITCMTGGSPLLTGTAALLPHLDMVCRCSAEPAQPSHLTGLICRNALKTLIR